MDRSRRSVLRHSGAVLAVGLAGCATSQSEPNPSAPQPDTSGSPTATSRGTMTLDPNPDLNFAAEVVSQSSSESPAVVQASLTNSGSGPVELGIGPTLLFSDTGPEENPDWASEIVIDPETYIGGWSDPVRTENGCWRFPEDGDQPIQSSLEYHKLDPGQSLSERYRVYTDASANTCLPAGSYRFQDIGILNSESQSFVLTLVLRVRDDGELSASTEEPVVTSDQS